MNSGSFFDDEVLSINQAVKHQIKREVDQARIHLKDHVNTKGQVLQLRTDCEYFQINFDVVMFL